MRRKRAWEIAAAVALLLGVALAAVNGYSWHLRRQKLNESLVAELQRSAVSIAAIRRLLDQGADIRSRGPQGETVLTAAAWDDDLALAKKALDSGVPVNVGGPASSALVVAAAMGSSGMAELLLARGAMADEREPDGGKTPLMWAAFWCQPAAIRTLLSAGADPTLRDDTGRTALDLARLQRSNPVGRAESVRLLKEALVRKRRAALDWNAMTQGRIDIMDSTARNSVLHKH